MSSVLPLGRQLAVYRDDPSPGQVSVDLQLGADRPTVSGTAFRVWSACHGRLDRPAGSTWGLAEVTATVAPWGLTGEDVDLGWAELVAVGAVTTLADDDDAREAFARAHRLHPLQLGLGNTAEDPATFSVGLMGQPLLGMPKALYDLWGYSGLARDLWASVVAHEQAYRPPGTDPAPHRLLAELTASLHALLAAHAAYLAPA